ncbi:hypothetical protein LJC23_02655 [Desulfovibrio sp. OttesenSCG-928-I05]|nr:hypothetical protein [Desulfovibrio sp. OttesenSCG-928-I05]
MKRLFLPSGYVRVKWRIFTERSRKAIFIPKQLFPYPFDAGHAWRSSLRFTGAKISRREELLMSDEWISMYGQRWEVCQAETVEDLKKKSWRRNYAAKLEEVLSPVSLVN